MDDNRQKIFGFIFFLFLFLIYKQMVLDPYFYGSKDQAPALQPTPTAAPAAAPAEATPTTQFAVPTAAPAVPQPAAPAQAAYPTDAQVREAGEVVVETDMLRVRISLLGGRVTSLELKRHEAALHSKTPLNLVEHVEYAPYPLGVYAKQGPESSAELSDAWVVYKLTSRPSASSISSKERLELTLEGAFPDGRAVQKTLAFTGDSYIFDLNLSIFGSAPNQGQLAVEWTRLIPPNSPTLLDPYNIGELVWSDGKRASRKEFKKFEEELAQLNVPRQALGDVSWVSLADKYFATALIAPEGLAPAEALKTGQLYRTRLSGSNTAEQVRIFAGPKSYRMLSDYGYRLEQNVNLGYTGIVSAPLLVILHLLYGLLKNYGLAIIALTILVKLVLLPLTSASFKQMRAMQDLQPEIQRLRDTITDKAQQQQAMMELYKKRGVNPLGGCLPILIQLPIFIGLYSALLLAIELRHAPFAVWIHDLSAMERAMIFGFGIPIMAILFVISMLVQQVTTPSPGMDPMQKKMMLVMPLVFGFFFITAPAGLTLYWLTSNLISIGQNYALRTAHPRYSALVVTIGVSGILFLFAFGLTLLG